MIIYWLKNYDDTTWNVLARAVEKVGGHKNVVTRLRTLAKGVAGPEETGDEAKGSENQDSESGMSVDSRSEPVHSCAVTLSLVAGDNY